MYSSTYFPDRRRRRGEAIISQTEFDEVKENAQQAQTTVNVGQTVNGVAVPPLTTQLANLKATVTPLPGQIANLTTSLNQRNDLIRYATEYPPGTYQTTGFVDNQRYYYLGIIDNPTQLSKGGIVIWKGRTFMEGFVPKANLDFVGVSDGTDASIILYITGDECDLASLTHKFVWNVNPDALSALFVSVNGNRYAQMRLKGNGCLYLVRRQPATGTYAGVFGFPAYVVSPMTAWSGINTVGSIPA